MAFDMYFTDHHELIDHHEEFLFYLLDERTDLYPELFKLWEQFYDGPLISAKRAKRLAEELILLLDNQGGVENHALLKIVYRLVIFFMRAVQEQAQIKCMSD